MTDTRHVVVTRMHAHTTRDKGTKALTVVSGEVRAELPRLFLCERPSSIAPRWVKGGRPESECTQSGKESVQLQAVHHCCGANRGRIVSLQSRYSSPFINSFSVTLDPNESMPAPSRRNLSFSGTMLTLVCPFIYIYMGLYTYYKHFQDKY